MNPIKSLLIDKINTFDTTQVELLLNRLGAFYHCSVKFSKENRLIIDYFETKFTRFEANINDLVSHLLVDNSEERLLYEVFLIELD